MGEVIEVAEQHADVVGCGYIQHHTPRDKETVIYICILDKGHKPDAIHKFNLLNAPPSSNG